MPPTFAYRLPVLFFSSGLRTRGNVTIRPAELAVHLASPREATSESPPERRWVPFKVLVLRGGRHRDRHGLAGTSCSASTAAAMNPLEARIR
jgi:hypothetical protein